MFKLYFFMHLNVDNRTFCTSFLLLRALSGPRTIGITDCISDRKNTIDRCNPNFKFASTPDFQKTTLARPIEKSSVFVY